ncbi:MAG: BamA/TamA family outer membrane protein, partial [Limnochordia bacterium]|nr:BamA/TamA family outer membrane protein [Limnochordia bacterium]
LWSNERVLGLDWLGKKEEFRGMVATTTDDAQYYQAISGLLSTLQNAHTHLNSPQSLPLFVRDYRNIQPWAGTMTEKVHQAYQYWQKTIGESSVFPPFYARYISGEYVVVASSNEALPNGALLLEVDDQPVHEYVSGCLDRVELRLDPLRNQMYAPYMPTPTLAKTRLTFKFDGRIQQVVLDTAGSSGPGHLQDNVTFALLEVDRVAYLRIRSFRTGSLEAYNPILACNRYVTMGAQLRFCGPNNLSLVLLADGGSVWGASEPITFDQLRSSTGIALQWLSPVGFVLEAKYARSLTDPGVERFTFGLCTQY